jgi:hypothetical protein
MDGHYIAIPGTKTHELPPLLVRSAPETAPLGEVLDMAAGIVDADDMMAGFPDEGEIEQRKYDLAVNLTEQYLRLIAHWQWGDSIVEWIRQCEITFETEDTLRHLLRADVWPHASRSSFVTLLVDKAVETPGVDVENAVGFRLTFRHPPPIDCFSNQFLFYLNSRVAGSVYQAWAHMAPEAPVLPPERFHFEVLDMAQ